MKTQRIQKCTKKKQSGFTLLELLVAMVIFSLMSIMAYGGLANVITGNEIIAEQEQRLKELQRTMMFLERDLRQIVPRPRSTGYNQFAKAFDYGLDSDGLLEFTRAGNPNPIAQARSSLQRVRYDLEDKVLIRKSWALVDHIDLEPTSMKLLKDVVSLELRLLDKNKEWQDNWKLPKEVPEAIEITIDHTHWGKIKRLIPVK